jgi:hypothetical protein
VAGDPIAGVVVICSPGSKYILVRRLADCSANRPPDAALQPHLETAEEILAQIGARLATCRR